MGLRLRSPPRAPLLLGRHRLGGRGDSALLSRHGGRVGSGLCGAWTYVDAMEAVEPDEVGWSYSAPVLPDGFIAVGHAIWHIFAAYGLHCLVCVVIFMRAPLQGTHCYFLRSKNPIANLWLLVFPIVKYARDPLAAESWKLAPAAAPNVEV